MQVQKEIKINGTPDKVWDVLAHNFHRVGEWATPIPSSKVRTDVTAPAGADVAGRVCSTSFGEIKETFTEYDEDAKRYQYKADGMPGFVKDARNRWQVRSAGPSSSMVSMQLDVELGGIGKVMAPMMKMSMNKQSQQILDDLKFYVEHGKPSADKTKALAKAAKKR